MTKFDKDSLKASIARDSFFDFVKDFWDVIIPEKPVYNWHVEYLCHELQVVAERVFRGEPKKYDLVINISPGTTKSTLCSIMFPTWCWTRMPTSRTISASYAHSLAMDLSRKSRDLAKSDQFLKWYPEIRIREEQDTKAYFVNGHGGDRFAVGVKGSVTGMHAHFLIVDDPLDPNQAMSEAELRAVNHWMENTLPSRKVDKLVTPLILIQQRLHFEDPSGILLEKSKKGIRKIFHICLPAELPPRDKSNVSPPELRDHYINGLMDPIRLSQEVLDEYKSNGIYAYASQFQQSPLPLGGGLFRPEYFNQRRKAAPYDCTRVRYWDRAGTVGPDSDFTVGVLIAKDKEGNFYIEHMERGQWEPGDRNNRILAIAHRDRTRYGKHQPRIYIEAEGGSSGRDAWKSVARKLAGFPIYEDRVTGNKEIRAHPWSAQLQAGNVWVCEDDSWDLNYYIAEHCAFPLGKHDDVVDSSTGAFNLLVNKGGFIGMRTLPILPQKKQNLVQIILCSLENIPSIDPKHNTLAVRFLDPRERPKNLDIPHVKEYMDLECADVDPRDYQHRWEKKIKLFNRKPGEVILSLDTAKKFWAFVLKQRQENPRSILFIGDMTRKALSVATGFAKAFRRELDTLIIEGESPYNVLTGETNTHIVETIKTARSLVR